MAKVFTKVLLFRGLQPRWTLYIAIHPEHSAKEYSRKSAFLLPPIKHQAIFLKDTFTISERSLSVCVLIKLPIIFVQFRLKQLVKGTKRCLFVEMCVATVASSGR